MSRQVCVLLDADAVYAMARDGTGSVTRVPWRPDTPAPMIDALRAVYGAPSALVVIVGLAWLEWAEPQLPPVANDLRVRMLLRDSDRYFALRLPAAVATDGAVAFAMPSARLTSWIEALSAWSPVRAVVTIGQAAALAGCNGEWTVPAGEQATGALGIRNGQVQAVRRVRGGAADGEQRLSLNDVAEGAWRAVDAGLDLQLLDAAMRQRLQRQRTRRWWQAAAGAAAALMLVVWSADRWRERQFVAWEREAHALTLATTGARAAQERLGRAVREQSALAEASRRAAQPDAPAAVLARLGALLPRDAFVQRLEWNGAEWRIDGSANDAALLVPLLDADAQFVNVRAAAPSLRYREGGRARSSFSLVFQAAGETAAARGRP